MRSARVKMLRWNGPRRPRTGERDGPQTKIIAATADTRDRIEGKGEHFIAKQRVAGSRMYACAISTFQSKVNNANVSMLTTDVFYH